MAAAAAETMLAVQLVATEAHKVSLTSGPQHHNGGNETMRIRITAVREFNVDPLDYPEPYVDCILQTEKGIAEEDFPESGNWKFTIKEV